MTKILFNILAHESPEVLTHQLTNFAKYNPGQSIVVHIDEKMGSYSPPSQLNAEIIINPKRYNLKWIHSLLHAWFDNFTYANGHNFDWVELHTSNDLFVKHGRHTYDPDVDWLAWDFVWDSSSWFAAMDHWPIWKHMKTDDRWNNFTDVQRMSTSLATGESVRPWLFQHMIDKYDTEFGSNHPACAFEELYLATVAHSCTDRILQSTQVQETTKHGITIEMIDKIRNNHSLDYRDILSVMPVPPPESHHQPVRKVIDTTHVYSARRFPRIITDATRQYISGLDVE